LYFFGGTWLIAAWCELRADFRSFRLDRVRELAESSLYPSEDGKRLADYVRAMQAQSRALYPASEKSP